MQILHSDVPEPFRFEESKNSFVPLTGLYFIYVLL